MMRHWKSSFLIMFVAVTAVGTVSGCTESDDQAELDTGTNAVDADATDAVPSAPGVPGDVAALTGSVSDFMIGGTLEDFKTAFPMPAGAKALRGDGYNKLGLEEWGWELEDRQYVSVGYEGDKVWLIDWWRNDMTPASVTEFLEEELRKRGSSSFVTDSAAGTGRIWSGDEASRLIIAWTDNPYGCTIIIARNSEFALLDFRPDYVTGMVRLMEMLDAPPAGMYSSSGR